MSRHICETGGELGPLDINKLRGLVQLLKHDLQELRRELKQQLSGADKQGKGKAKDFGIDYGRDAFEWAKGLKG